MYLHARHEGGPLEAAVRDAASAAPAAAPNAPTPPSRGCAGCATAVPPAHGHLALALGVGAVLAIWRRRGAR